MVEVFEGSENLGHANKGFGLLRSLLLRLTQGIEGELVFATFGAQAWIFCS